MISRAVGISFALAGVALGAGDHHYDGYSHVGYAPKKVVKKNLMENIRVYTNVNQVDYTNQDIDINNFKNDQTFINVENNVNKYVKENVHIEKNVKGKEGGKSNHGGKGGKELDISNRDYKHSRPYKQRSRDFILFVTNRIITATSSLPSRKAANEYCAFYAKANNLPGKHFRIIYSTANENARDFLAYTPNIDRVCTRSLGLLSDLDIYDGTSPVLPDMQTYTITNTGPDGNYITCDADLCPRVGFPKCVAGSFPISQPGNLTFSCGSRSSPMLDPFETCCWRVNENLGRAVMCMGSLDHYDTCTPIPSNISPQLEDPETEVNLQNIPEEVEVEEERE